MIIPEQKPLEEILEMLKPLIRFSSLYTELNTLCVRQEARTKRWEK